VTVLRPGVELLGRSLIGKQEPLLERIEGTGGVELPESPHDRLAVLVGIRLQVGTARVEIFHVEKPRRADGADPVDRLVAAVARGEHRLPRPVAVREGIARLHHRRRLDPGPPQRDRRQIDLLESGDKVRQETRHWDETDGRTHTLRAKEDADDYRYFLEPDLVPLNPSHEWIQRVHASMPPLPAARRAHLAVTTGQPANGEAVMSVVERGQDHYVLAVGHLGGDAARALVYVKEAFADQGTDPAVPAIDIAALTNLEVEGKVTATQAKAILAEILANGGGDAAAIAQAKGFEALDTSALESVVDRVIAEQADAWAKFCAGDGKAMGAIVGAVMKATQGKADGKLVTALLNQKKG